MRIIPEQPQFLVSWDLSLPAVCKTVAIKQAGSWRVERYHLVPPIRLHLDASNVNAPEIDDAPVASLSKDTAERIMRFRTEDSDGWVEFMAIMKQENPQITSLPEGLVSSVGGAEKTQIQAPVVYAEACEGITHREKPAEQPKAKPKRPKM